ncbi:MAG: bifunctional 5,10-methylenetetrahydrofolate dehydrogenase/5,10-methenyltetrahydrofolate cyclohydrolase [Tissierellia bacterium]|nr:bifunctional 5,10-methylenetetrahydrofolate dehydrogenase/5,10-methenyltetrahydrofolate cyclohydrolase [Tissierellia bacterium]
MRYLVGDLKKTLQGSLTAQVEELQRDRPLTLAVVRMGERPEDLAYERGLRKSTEAIGMTFEVNALPEDVGLEELKGTIGALNGRDEVAGVLLFKPLPRGFDEAAVNEFLDPMKDPDCATATNQWKVFTGASTIEPATAKSARYIARDMFQSLQGKHVVVVNRSMVIGKPLSMMLLGENATVTVAHSRTQNLEELVASADILITGTGKGHMFGPSFAHPELAIIDCGISFTEDGMVGDVDTEAVEELVKHVTPVPGGVGAITNLCLLENALLQYREAHSSVGEDH